jgi:hypothetical protein
MMCDVPIMAVFVGNLFIIIIIIVIRIELWIVGSSEQGAKENILN